MVKLWIIPSRVLPCPGDIGAAISRHTMYRQATNAPDYLDIISYQSNKGNQRTTAILLLLLFIYR